MLVVLVADPQKVVREGMKRMLTESDLNLSILEAVSGPQILELIKNATIDLLITEVNMKSLDGRCIIQFINKHYKKIRIIIHSHYSQERLVESNLSKGAKGYITKEDGNLVEAVKIVMANRYYISNSLNKIILPLQKRETIKSTREIQFTTIELCILYLSAKGYNSEEIAHKMGNKRSTIDFQRKRMIKKFNVKNFIELVHYAHGIGLLR